LPPLRFLFFVFRCFAYAVDAFAYDIAMLYAADDILLLPPIFFAMPPFRAVAFRRHAMMLILLLIFSADYFIAFSLRFHFFSLRH